MSKKYPAHVRHAIKLAEQRKNVFNTYIDTTAQQQTPYPQTTLQLKEAIQIAPARNVNVSIETTKSPTKPSDKTILISHPGKGYCTIFDIGAGTGGKSLKWLKEKSNALIYAFEPDPRQFEILKKNRDSLDDNDKRRIQIYNLAISDVSKEQDFYIANDQSSSSLLPFVKENIRKWKYPPGRYFFDTLHTIKVPTIRLDEFLENHSVNRIDFLYIEAQGVADKVLNGITSKRLSHVKEILVKAHSTNFDIYKGQARDTQIIDMLKKNNFDIIEKNFYSKNQERFIRSVNNMYKNKGTIIYGFK